MKLAEHKAKVQTIAVDRVYDVQNQLLKFKLLARRSGRKLTSRAIATLLLLAITEADAAKLLELEAA